MLTLIVKPMELYDEDSNTFTFTKECALSLEHSLVSISKWESIYCIPFLAKEKKTPAQTLDYIKCMTITKNVDPKVYSYLTNDNLEEVNSYIGHSATATKLKSSDKVSNEIITSEKIYCLMIDYNIPFECQKWHLNRLITLLALCQHKNEPAKKVNQKELATQRRELNEQRRKASGTKG